MSAVPLFFLQARLLIIAVYPCWFAPPETCCSYTPSLHTNAYSYKNMFSTICCGGGLGIRNFHFFLVPPYYFQKDFSDGQRILVDMWGKMGDNGEVRFQVVKMWV